MRKFVILLVTLLLLFSVVGNPMIASADGPDSGDSGSGLTPVGPVIDSGSGIVGYTTNFIFCGASCF